MVVFSGPIWHQSRDGAVLLASLRYNGSRSRKTKGSLADILQCNIWQRAQTPHLLTHCLHGGVNHGQHNGFAALGKKIGTSKSTQTDSDYGASGALSLKCHVNHEQTMCKPECMTCMPLGAGIGAGCAKSDSTT